MSRWIVGVALMAAGCTPAKKTAGGRTVGAPPPSIDTKADEAQIAQSWLSALQADAEPLVKLAESNAGWKSVFGNEPVAALEAFEAGVKAGDADAGIGYARAALELAAAHRALGRVVIALTPTLMKAQSTRPDAAASAAGRAFILARHAEATGGSGARPAQPAPYPATESYAHRLAIRAAVVEGRVREARARLKRIDPRHPDLEVGAGEAKVSFRDPLTADVAGDVYAALALDATKDAAGWPQILAAEAELLLGRAKAADQRLTTLLASPPAAEPALSQLVLSLALNGADLNAYAHALHARAKVRGGDAAGAKALVAKLGDETVARRVFKAWAQSAAGTEIDAAAFPGDRGELSRAVLAALDAQAKKAGADDVAQLQLVDRYVDALQRLFADALEAADKRALAVRMHEGAEDKAKAATPSARNALSSLANSAHAYVTIKQPRIALKYLTRLGHRLPAVAGPVEMLRDVLAMRAMGQGGGATTGQ